MLFQLPYNFFLFFTILSTLRVVHLFRYILFFTSFISKESVDIGLIFSIVIANSCLIDISYNSGIFHCLRYFTRLAISGTPTTDQAIKSLITKIDLIIFFLRVRHLNILRY